MSDDGTYLVPVVVTPATGAETLTWLLGKHFPLDGGINGLAASGGTAIWTDDYAADARIPHDPDDVDVASRMGLVGMAAAPLRAPGGEVIGTLAISSSRPRSFDAEELDLLQGLADQAAIAITNSTLLGKLTESEERYRYLIENAPDIVWSIGADTRLTFVSDAAERLTGFRPDELVGRHFGELLHLRRRRSPSSTGRPAWRSARRRSAAGSTCSTATGRRSRPSSWRPPGSTSRASSSAPTGRSATCATATASSASCATPRSATGRSPRHRPTWSSRPTPRAATRSSAIRPTTRSAGTATPRSGGISASSWRPAARPRRLPASPSWSRDPTSVHTARIEFVRGDGTSVPLEINVVGSLEDGRLSAIHGVARDISERERLERELHESEARFRQLVQTTPDVIYRCDAEGRFLFVAEGSERLFGRTPAELIGMTFSDVTAPESLPEAMRNFAEQHTEHDVVRRFRYLVLYHDGTSFPAEISSVSVWEDGQFAGVQGTVRDVTQQERLERELRESQERYRFLVENSPDVVFSTDTEGRFTFMSESMERMTGWRPDEVIGAHFSMTVAEASHADARARWAALVADPQTEQVVRIELKGPDGRLVPVEVSAVGMTDAEGRFAGIHGSTRDISERSRLERDLRRQAGELAAGEERAHLARELHDSVTQALFSMTLVSRSVEMLLDRDAGGGADPARAAARPPARGAGRDARADLRAPAGQPRAGRADAARCGPTPRRCRAASGCRSWSRAPSTSGCRLQIEEVLYRIVAGSAAQRRQARRRPPGPGRARADRQRRPAADQRRRQGLRPGARAGRGTSGWPAMRARATKIGARFTVRSAPGSGTTIEVTVGNAALADAGTTPPPAAGRALHPRRMT